jgi:hypothetical protein
MKRVFLTLLGAIVLIGALAGAGFAGYRLGLRQGMQVSVNGDIPFPVRPDRLGPQEMPRQFFNRDFDRGFNRDFPRGGFRMTHSGRGGFGFFSPFMILGHIVFWGLIILMVYLLFTRSGWTLTRTQQPVQGTSPNIEAESKPQEQETKNE